MRMAQVNVSLPDDLSRWAETRVAQGHYGNPGEYLRELVRRDREDEEKFDRLRAAIDEGLASPIVDTTIEDIIARGRARHGVK